MVGTCAVTAMRTLQLEFVAEREPSTIAMRLEAAGIRALPGHDPVPMRGAGSTPDTLVVTVLVPASVAADSLKEIPGVLRVIGDVRVGPIR